jgi:prepilin-type N-terminal cleavage/methylation domain-containing protein
MLHRTRFRRAFTLTELIVVIALIVILIGILIPVIGKMQANAKAASTAALVSQLTAGIEAYYGDFHAYPGPLSNMEVYAKMGGTAPMITYVGTAPGANYDANRITMSENLFLGLCGGLTWNTANARIDFNQDYVGKGPGSLNQYQPKQYHTYIEATDVSDSWKSSNNGHFSDEAGSADDTLIPEFLDRFNNPMPILYMRARVGATGGPAAPTSAINPVITDGTGARLGQYDLSQIIAYTGSFSGTYPGLALVAMTTTGGNGASIGMGKDLPEYFSNSGIPTPKSKLGRPPYHGLSTVHVAPDAVMTPPGPNYYLPYDCYPYFTNSALTDPTTNVRTAKQKDRYILISAGKDRVYGTDDDITSFGSVAP